MGDLSALCCLDWLNMVGNQGQTLSEARKRAGHADRSYDSNNLTASIGHCQRYLVELCTVFEVT